MKETISGWNARNKDEHSRCCFYNERPYYSPSWMGFRWKKQFDRDLMLMLSKTHNLKPGEIKRATLTVEISK